MKYFLLATIIVLSGCSTKDDYTLFNKATPSTSKKITTTLKNVVSFTNVHSIILANIMIKPNEISSIFRLTSNILQPFVNIKVVSN